MIAVTERPGISNVTSPTAWVDPYHAFRRSVLIAGASYFIAHGNEQFVQMLSRDAS